MAVYVVPTPPAGSLAQDITVLEGANIGGTTVWPTDWSADGRALAGYLRGRGRSVGVAVYDVASSVARKLTDDAAMQVSWLPDSRHLLYFIDGTTLVTVDSVTGRRIVVDVSLPLPQYDSFAVAPDGRMIYYGGARSEADIWIVERPARGQ